MLARYFGNYYEPHQEIPKYAQTVSNANILMRGKIWYVVGPGRNAVGQNWLTIGFRNPAGGPWFFTQVFDLPKL